MKKQFPYRQFDSELHRAWKHDRSLRGRVPFNETWRGCLALAALWHNTENAEWIGDRVLCPNDNITWAAMRDVPPGHFPGSPAMNRRDVAYTSLAQGKLLYGMPHLDFSLPTLSFPTDSWRVAEAA